LLCGKKAKSYGFADEAGGGQTSQHKRSGPISLMLRLAAAQMP